MGQICLFGGIPKRCAPGVGFIKTRNVLGSIVLAVARHLQHAGLRVVEHLVAVRMAGRVGWRRIVELDTTYPGISDHFRAVSGKCRLKYSRAGSQYCLNPRY
jgi:hypothetical protein